MSTTRVPVRIIVTDFYVTDLDPDDLEDAIEQVASDIHRDIRRALDYLGDPSAGNVSVECAGHEGTA
jgi:hypothetical protein